MEAISQRVVVIGAGVTGITTAYALARRGFSVTVVERLGGPALETSRANAGQRSYGYVYPWASPAMLKHALPWLLSRDGPLKIALPPSPQTVRFLARTLRFIFSKGLYLSNKRAMLELARYSRDCFIALEQELNLSFDGQHRGLMELASSARVLNDLKVTARLLTELGVDNQLLSSEQVRQVEPGLTGKAPVYGALRILGDGTGDCHHFTKALAVECERLGVAFQYDTSVTDAELDGGRIRSLVVAPAGAKTPQKLEGDHFVLCAGCDSREIGEHLGETLPIYPVKGYSLTAPLLDPARGPQSTVVDDRFKVVVTRLGDRLRATGFVELADRQRNIPEQRLNTLRRAIASRFPGASDWDTAEPWTGFRPMTPDGPPIIGPGKRANLFLNTGHGTFGWTLSAASAELTAQALTGETPAVSLTSFRPGRFR